MTATAPGTTEPTEEPAPGVRPARRGQIASFGTGRTCREPGCTTRLSIYNEQAICANHGPGRQ